MYIIKKLRKGSLGLVIILLFQSCCMYNGLYVLENKSMITEYFDIRNGSFDYYYSTDLSGNIHDHGRVSRNGDSLLFSFYRWEDREKALTPTVVESSDNSNSIKYRFHFIKPNLDTVIGFGYLSVNNASYETDSFGNIELIPRIVPKEFRYSDIVYYSPYYVKDATSNVFDIYIKALPKFIDSKIHHLNTKLSMILKSDTIVSDKWIYVKRNREIKKHITENW